MALRLVREIFIEASPARVFDAWSTADAVALWFAPHATVLPDVQWNFREGGSYRIAMKVGIGAAHTTSGRFQEIKTNKKLVFTWQCDAFDEPETTVSVSFEAEGTGTRVCIEHWGFVTETTKDAHNGGWQACEQGLKTYLEKR